ncbi:MAG TPA: MBL fold metallo-hydrolase [Solirubrobacteraceae bacterium]|nr:MBL fold metallo-hydrolase [Solirubrobacteraceae bacterium]
MKLKVWGARGSIPAPGPETMHYGGNTSCVELTLSDGSTLILDAGTGIRNLGLALPRQSQQINILLTHLHLDHIQGLMFFAPAFWPESEITIWGPASPEASLQDRVARYISAPLAPVEVRELPSQVSFREAEPLQWEIGPATIHAQAVTHRGPTLGYRIEDGDRTLCYIPDHEPGLGAPLAKLDDDWISGFELAHDAELLVHDCQYTDQEYSGHLGWGHCPISDALAFARRVAAKRLLLFHHDPLHSDEFLDGIGDEVAARWAELGGHPDAVELATERMELEVAERHGRATAGAPSTRAA